MTIFRQRYCAVAFVAAPLALALGCGTTRLSDSARTATEQLLISTAVDRAINQIDLEPMTGKSIFFDTQYLAGTTDEKYVTSSLIQHLLSYGCILKEKREDADYVLVARSGAVGTNRHDVMVGVPSVNLPSITAITGVPSSIPEIPFAKTTEQTGVAKLALFAYNRQSGRAYWQSGVFPVASNAKDTWFLGAGPFQQGSIYDGTNFAGSRLIKPFRSKPQVEPPKPRIPVTAEAIFSEPTIMADKSATPVPADDKSARATAPGSGDRAASGPTAQLAENTETGAIVTEFPASADSDETNVMPAAHLMRLSPLDQAERPDLRPGPIPADSPTKILSPPRRLGSESSRHARPVGDFDRSSDEAEIAPDEDSGAQQAQDAENTVERDFSLFDPRTWF